MNRGAKVLHEASLQGITVVLGALVRPKRSNGPSRREADWATTSHTAGGVDSPLSCPTL